jgi:hypothetical protein
VDEARPAGDAGGQLGEALLRQGIAVDRDEQPLGTEPAGDQLGVPAGAEGAVDRRLPRPRIRELDELAGEDRDVDGGHVSQHDPGSP